MQKMQEDGCINALLRSKMMKATALERASQKGFIIGTALSPQWKASKGPQVEWAPEGSEGTPNKLNPNHGGTYIGKQMDHEHRSKPNGPRTDPQWAPIRSRPRSRCLPMQDSVACRCRIQVPAYAGSRCLPVQDPGAYLCRIQISGWSPGTHVGGRVGGLFGVPFVLAPFGTFYLSGNHLGPFGALFIYLGPWDPCVGRVGSFAANGPYCGTGPSLS